MHPIGDHPEAAHAISDLQARGTFSGKGGAHRRQSSRPAGNRAIDKVIFTTHRLLRLDENRLRTHEAQASTLGLDRESSRKRPHHDGGGHA